MRLQSPAQLHHETEDTSSAKKPRVVWSVEMHQQFVNAVNSLGIDSEPLPPPPSLEGATALPWLWDLRK